MKEKLNNKKGFTLVELIVVIVIILILAAVMIPNVMRYIGQARESTFQSDASAYLTEVQGYAAEGYAKDNKDIKNSDDHKKIVREDTTGTELELTDFDDGLITIQDTTVPKVDKNAPSGKVINVEILHGEVKSFSYQDTDHWVNWTQAGGWTNVDTPTAAPAGT